MSNALEEQIIDQNKKIAELKKMTVKLTMSVAKGTIQIKYGDELIKKLREENTTYKNQITENSDQYNEIEENIK